MDAAKLSFQMEKKIEISILKSVEEFLSDLESCEQRITDIKTDSVRLQKHVSTKMRNGLKDLEKYFSRNIPSFRSDIYEILQEVRLGNEEISALVDRRKDFIDQLTNPFDKLQSLEEEFAEKLSLTNYLKRKGFTLFGEGDRNALNDAKSASKDSHGVFFAFQFCPNSSFRDSQEENIALVDSALADPDVFKTPNLYAVDLDVLEFGFPSPLPVQVHVNIDSVFITHDLLEKWKEERSISVVRVKTTSDDVVPIFDAGEIERCKQILQDHKFARYRGTYPGKKFKFLVSCPNQRCQSIGCQIWCCQECKKPVELAVRSEQYQIL